MNTLDKQYQALLQDILDNGVRKQDRTGTGTISLFGKQIRHKMSEGFPLLTTKKMPFRLIATELIWFLRGDTNIKFLVDNDCHIWDGDAYKNYCNWYNQQEGFMQPPKHNIESFIERIKTDDEFAKKWGELGPVYGKQWRNWTYLTREQKEDIDGIDELICGVDTFDSYRSYRTFDQISNLINDLKTNPDSRRLMVNAWNVGELDSMVLPPCHYGFQVYTRELSIKERLDLASKTYSVFDPSDFVKCTHDEIDELYPVPTRAISLMWNQRSVDTFLGLPFNIASYGLLLEIIAKEVNMVPDELIGNLGDTHLYLDHIEQAKEQIGRALSDEERYNIWFNNNYETGMERFFDPNNLPNFDDPYWEPTPKRTREPYPLPTLNINTEFWPYEGGECGEGPLDAIAVLEGFHNDHFCKCLLEEDLQLSNYQAHPHIKAPLSN
jgi:thymidylate synthase